MESKEKTYMVLDLNDYSVSYLEDVPEGGWTDAYRTYKLVLRYIPAGTFMMGSPDNEPGKQDDETQHKVTLTRPFYMGVFQVTQKQYTLITGCNPSWSKGDTRPVENVSYQDIRGKEKGAQWPDNNSVDEDSFFGIIRAKSKLDFDLPTEAQWEYACRAGTKTVWNNGTDLTDNVKDYELDKLGRYEYNVDWGVFNNLSCHVKVGLYLPNAWGLYDMHGNVWEWCLDWYGEYSNTETTDPKGTKSEKCRVLRGGSWSSIACFCRSFYRNNDYPKYARHTYGFRVVLVL